MISDLPRDLAERVLSRLLVTSLRGVRSTCKNWKVLSKKSFTKRHIGEGKEAAKKRKELQAVMMLDFRVYLFNVNLLNAYMERIGKLVSLDDADRSSEISQIFHCSCLLLCITKDKSTLVVWNPCSGQTRWIEPPIYSHYNILDRYALGYEKKSLKVLRFVDGYDPRVNHRVTKFEIYNLNTNSWKVVDGVSDPEWEIESHHYGVSLKGGNTYCFFVDEKKKVAVVVDKDCNRYHPTRNMAYIIGKNGYVKQVDLGDTRHLNCFPLACSFVPSSV
ncbi:hypothetical protein F2Q68_00020431 [Brassica cretica]|uniref:F-box domain-containing protein n=1 Tax=Brassica cretica TaxID=69181 RepID=A0A8S9FYM1_BRACR|nr:hypothetical protein F2Q68_00020431 [Brassica cretica]